MTTKKDWKVCCSALDDKGVRCTLTPIALVNYLGDDVYRGQVEWVRVAFCKKHFASLEHRLGLTS